MDAMSVQWRLEGAQPSQCLGRAKPPVTANFSSAQLKLRLFEQNVVHTKGQLIRVYVRVHPILIIYQQVRVIPTLLGNFRTFGITILTCEMWTTKTYSSRSASLQSSQSQGSWAKPGQHITKGGVERLEGFAKTVNSGEETFLG